MELDSLWQWERKKLPCKIRHESGNPAGDELRERFAELAGVNLQELLNDMKSDKKRRETKNKVSYDHVGDKRYKDMLFRSHVLGASSIAISKVNESEKKTSSSMRNTRKRFLSIPESPPTRVLLDIQRERGKPLRLPENEEKNLATVKLEKKLAKQRAQRMAAKDEAAKDDENDSAKEMKSIFGAGMKHILPKYGGDMFGTAGEYMGGMLYLSRMPPKRSHQGTAMLKSFSRTNTLQMEDSQGPDDEADLAVRNVVQNSGEDEDTEISSKLYCATALCNWARNPSNAQRLANEGAVRAIILLSNEKVAKISVYCAGAFRYMSEHTVLAEKMIEEKCVNVISEMITSCNDDFISGNLAICLLNLTRISGREWQLVEDSIVLCFMNLISQRSDLHSACCRGLYNLTCIDTSYPMMERVIRALITLSSSGTASVKHLCASALCNLADLKGIRLRMVEEGVISVLGTLARGAETRTRRVCAVILQNLTATKACRTEMVSRNCVQVAYGLSSDQDPIILRCIGLALSRLALESSNSTRVISDGGIMALCNIAVKYPTIPGISQPAAVAFQLLSSRPSVRITIVQEGSVAAIASLLRLSGDIFTLQHGLLALCNLLSSPDNHLPIVQQGLVTTLTVLSAHESDLLKDFCALAYFNLSCAEESRKHIVNAGAITSVINLSTHNSAITKRRCAATLCNIASYEIGMQRMVADGIIPALVKLLVADDIETVRYGCAALCRLCTTVENCALILESGAVSNVVQGALEGDITTKQFCCAVLSSLSYYETCRESLCDNNIISALNHLSEMTDDITRQRCLVAYANLSCEDKVQDRMVEEGVVDIIAKLADSYFEVNQMCCAKALCNLSRHTHTRTQLVREGGVQALMMISMVRSVDIQTKLLCVHALSNILDERTVDSLIEDGIVGALANLCSLHNHAITNCCARLMNQISVFPQGRVKIVEKNSGVRALFDTFGFTNDSDTKIVVARTACNLILCHQVRLQAIDHGGLEVIGNGAKLSNSDASLHCAMAALSSSLEPQFRMKFVLSALPSAITTVALESCDTKKLSFCVKSLAILVWTKESRSHLQTPLFVSNIMRLVDKNRDENVLIWIAQILYFICFDYKDYAELLELGMQTTLRKLCLVCNSTVAQCVAATTRCFCRDSYCVNILASSEVVDILQHVIRVDRSPTTLYHISCTLYAFTAHSIDSRNRVALPDIVELVDILGHDKECVEVLAATLCLFCSDVKTRTYFANKTISNLIVLMLEMNPREIVLSNIVHVIYSLSKMPSSRQFLLEAGADRILLKLSQSDNVKLKANCSRSLKNLSSDASETIEEGAVAALIAMSLEGKSSNKNAEDLEEPEIRHHEATAFGPLRPEAGDTIESGIDPTPWQMKTEIYKGDCAGRGPPAPEPPNMTTESSVDHPSTVDDLDSGETDVARTKMAFAKMQTPYELRDSYGFDDRDFEVHEEEVIPDENDDVSEEDDDEYEDDVTSTLSGGERSVSLADNNERPEKLPSLIQDEDDSINAASVYDQEEVVPKSKPKKKKCAVAKTQLPPTVIRGEVAAELGLY
eukprot:CAMPEP_0185036964 /NCGR_PEP_ID=MMETSP1103-20130426/30746_1 /TAXON_ID=36769 /ORGANISM="Paraphysomonas bandaiensis, Strain Caron Lab Isolate" /LENGTH=1556 /DNA_ID=CAMNT_0027574739 /DNA_START=14 /DNA_END=4684 /DNA_ORIENTATION=-